MSSIWREFFRKNRFFSPIFQYFQIPACSCIILNFHLFQNHKLMWATYYLITRMIKDSTDDYKNETNSATHWLYFLIQRSQKYFYIINLSKFSPTTANFLVSFKSSLGVIWRDFSKYSSQNICSRTSKKFLQIFFFIKIDAFLNPHQRGSYLFGKVLLYEKFSSILTISFYNVFPFPNPNDNYKINTAYNFINKM